MTQTVRNIIVGLVSFAVVAVGAFYVIQAVDPLADEDEIPTVAAAQAGPDVQPDLTGYFEAPVLTPVPFEGHASTVARELAENHRQATAAAYEAGLPSANPASALQVVAISTDELDTAMGGDATPGAPDTSPGDGSSTTTPIPAPFGESGIEEPPPPGFDTDTTDPEIAIDTCADSDDASCPDGVAGTVLAIRAIPEFGGTAMFDPPGPDEPITWDSTPQCEPDGRPGTATFGVKTTRPAEITMRYRAGRWTGGDYEFPETTFTLTTSDTAEIAWTEWINDDDAPEDDPRRYINHCFTLEDLPARGDWWSMFTYADKYNPSVTARNWRTPIDFYTTGPSGIEPGSVRRPTLVVPLDLDRVFVSATRTDSQLLEVVARPETDPMACDIAGDEGLIGTRDGDVGSEVISDGEIPSSIIDDPGYPYLRDHTHSVTHELNLSPGTDYTICIYWLGSGPSFDRRTVEEAESVRVSTPHAYQPRIVLHGLTDLYREPVNVTVSMPNCGYREFDLSEAGTIVTDRNGAEIAYPFPEELCTIESDVSTIDRRGLLVATTVETAVGETQRAASYIRMDLECGAECRVRLPEMTMVSLPEIASDGSECPDDPFTGCLRDSDYPAGKLIVEIQYVPTDGGVPNWVIGEPEPFDDSPRPLPETPQLSLDVSYRLNGDPVGGAVADVEITADRPVTLAVTEMQRFDESPDIIPGAGGTPTACSLPVPDPPGSAAVEAVVHSFTVDPLCLGSAYRVTIEAIDADGAIATFAGPVWGRSPDTPPNAVDLFVPTVRLTTAMDASITVTGDRNDDYTAYVFPVYVRSMDALGPIQSKLGWIYGPNQRSENQRNGWQIGGLDGRINGCSTEPSRAAMIATSRSTSGVPIMRTAFVGQENISIELDVEIHRNHEIGGAYGRCAVQELVERIELRRVVTLEELLDGIEISSADGAVSFQLDILLWDSDLNR